MSRSFIIETNQDKNLKVKDFMDNLKNLIIFNTTDLKIVHNRNNIYPDSFDEISLNTREFDRKNQSSRHKKPFGILEAEQTE
ncbi:MAG: hypothetical protein K2K91_05450, partial [Ruminococcus sp.]|nr:hypothetical protein [Ruminococcus sp.]